MSPRSFAFLFSLVLAIPASAQLPLAVVDEKAAAAAKELRLKVVEQIVAEVPGLRLQENRALALARSGSLLCRDDKKAAKDLFQRSVNELISAQLAAEADERSRPSQAAMQITRGVRPSLLNLIGICDGELALDGLYRTRTPSILRDLGAQPETGGLITDPNSGPAQTAQSELALEQRLLLFAAAQNPEIAAKVIQDSIRKGLSGDTLGLLKRLHAKDPETAAALARETMDRLLAGSFTPDPHDRNAAILAAAILSDHIRPVDPGSKDLRFDDSQVRILAGRYISYTIAQSARAPMSGNFTQAIRIAEKLAPASAAALRKLEQERRPAGWGPQPVNAEARRIMDSKSTPAQMILDARRIAVNDRRQVYQAAANRMASSGDHDGALAVLNQNFTGRALENAVANLNRNHAQTLMNQSRWQEAENLIEQFPDETDRRSSLIDLAKKAFAKDAAANRDLSLNVLRSVRTGMPERPADQQSTVSLVQLAVAYAPIDANEAFNTIETVIPVLNNLAEANAFVSAFRSDAAVRQGEYTLLPAPAYGFNLDPGLWRTLAKADPERTSGLIDQFARREIRIAMRFQAIGEPAR